MAAFSLAIAQKPHGLSGRHTAAITDDCTNLNSSAKDGRF